MGINTATKKFREDVTQAINNSNLPAVNVLLVLESIQNEVHNIYVQQIKEEETEKES